MSERTEGKEIYKRMAAILADFPAVAKSQSGDGISYNYRGIDDALGALHPLLAKHRVFMTTRWQAPEFSERKNRQGRTEHHVLINGALVFAADDGSCLTVGLTGEGQDTRDKAIMKAMANALKYAIWYTFAVPTAEKKDSEAYDAEPAHEGFEAPEVSRGTNDNLDHIIVRMAKAQTEEQYNLFAKARAALPEGSKERGLALKIHEAHRIHLKRGTAKGCNCVDLARSLLKDGN